MGDQFDATLGLVYLSFLRELLFQIGPLLIGESFGNPLELVVDSLGIGAEFRNALFIK